MEVPLHTCISMFFPRKLLAVLRENIVYACHIVSSVMKVSYINSVVITNKMQLGNGIYYSTVH